MPSLMKIIKHIVAFREPEAKENFILEEKEAEGKEKGSQKSFGEQKVKKSLKDNLKFMKEAYSIPLNSDIVLREFDIAVKDRVLNAFIMFFDGMTDRAVINQFILQPLMLLSNLEISNEEEDITEYIKNHILPQNQLKITENFRDIIDDVNFGSCAIFIDRVGAAFVADVKGWEHRGIERPNNELVLRGPQEGFNELLRANTALIRKLLLDEKLIVENATIGKRSRTPCAILYVKDIANESLVEEVRRRIKGINADYVLSSGELEQYIEDSTFLPAPQIMSTERPDRTAAHISEGKVAVIVNGSPFALIMPATVVGLMHSPEDSFARFPYGNFMRIIRLMGILLALLLPGLYVAITNYHQEMIPTDLVMSIVSAREKVPFPSVIEILIMEISFDLIREAGIRIPGPIGPTLGIIGALILGQAAVAANIVSPILIIIVAVTGIGNFTIPDYSLSFSIRILRFGYIMLGAHAGLLGITTGIFIHGLLMVGAKSFGVPFMAPFGPITSKKFTDTITRGTIWKQEKRPDYLNTKQDGKQADISREWVKEDKEGSKSGE